MKLELIHVASYIAHKVKVWDNKTNKPKTLHCTQLNLPIVENDRYKLILSPMSDLNHKERTCTPEYFKEISYSDTTYYLMNHYDIYGLIEQGLAIDINTL